MSQPSCLNLRESRGQVREDRDVTSQTADDGYLLKRNIRCDPGWFYLDRVTWSVSVLKLAKDLFEAHRRQHAVGIWCIPASSPPHVSVGCRNSGQLRFEQSEVVHPRNPYR